MSKKVLTLLSVAVVVMGLISVAYGNPTYFNALIAACPTAACNTCHTNPSGPPPFTAYGTAFSNIPTHSTNPSGAIAALGCPGTASTVPVPAAQQVFPAYAEIPTPQTNLNPALMEPIAVGTVAAGGGTVDLSVNTGTFAGLVDMYLAIYAPALSPEIFLLTPTGAQTFSAAGLVKWQSSVSGVNVTLFSVPKALIPAATYNLFLLVAPAGTLDDFYVWETALVLP